MERAQAKEIIAAYLSGYRTITREALAQACEEIKQDGVYLRYLREEFGLSDDWLILCDAFAERSAEFCEMNGAERRDEMGDLVDHLNACGSCRRLYWQIIPLWREQAASAARSFLRELSEQISLVIGQGGWLREQGLGPPPLHLRAFAPTLSVPESVPELPGVEKRKEWTLADEAADCEWRLVVEGQAGGGANVTLSLQAGPAQKVSSAQTRIEVRNAATGALLLGGRLADVESEPIRLPAGSWFIHLVAKHPGGSFAWKIPLELKAEA